MENSDSGTLSCCRQHLHHIFCMQKPFCLWRPKFLISNWIFQHFKTLSVFKNFAWVWMSGIVWYVTNSKLLLKISLLVWIRVLALFAHSEDIDWQVKSWRTEVSDDSTKHRAVQNVLEIAASLKPCIESAVQSYGAVAQSSLTLKPAESNQRNLLHSQLGIKLHTHYGNIHKLKYCWMTLD